MRKYFSKVIGSRNQGPSMKGGVNLKSRIKPRVSMKVIALVSTSFVLLMVAGVIIFSDFFNSTRVMAASAGDYRAVATGNWNTLSTWETYNGASWVAAGSAPSSGSGRIEIQSPFTVTVAANKTIDDMVVDAGATVKINAGKNLTIANGAGFDCTVDGTLNVYGTLTNQGNSSTYLNGLITVYNGGNHTFAGGSKITVNNGGVYDRQDASVTTSAGIWTVKSGGTYKHNIDGGSIVSAAWNSGSICEVTGITSTKPGNLNKTYSNFIWNCPNQTAVLSFSGSLTDITNDFTVVSTGTGSIRLGTTENFTLDIGGSYYHQGGTLFLSTKSVNVNFNIGGNLEISGGTLAGSDASNNLGEASPDIDISGDLIIWSGTFDMNQYTAVSGSKGKTTVNLYGNFIQVGGLLTETASNSGEGTINFKKTGAQTYTKQAGSITNTVNFTVNSNSILDLTDNIIEGGGDFTLSSGGGLYIGEANGITASASSGNIQVTGSRSFDTNADYTYNGEAAQSTGDGLPSTINDLKIDNSLDVTLTNNVSVSGTLTFTSGNIITASNTLTLGTSTANRGTLSWSSGSVEGNFKRWFNTSTVNNISFPVGSSGYYLGVNYSFTVAPTTGGTITVYYTGANPGTNGFNLYESGDTIKYVGFGYWTAVPGNGLAGGTFSVDITATSLPSVADYTKLHLLRRTNGASPWVLSGAHAAGTGSNAVPIVHRTGMTSHGQFGVGGGSSNPLPIELIYFNSKLIEGEVNLSWATASEINNDYFTIEKSKDGKDFQELFRKRGAGNSTTTLFYEDVDQYPYEGYTYYRLKQTDYDGHISYSEINSVYNNSLNKESEFRIITAGPNPFNDNVNISFIINQEAIVDFVLVNSTGQITAKDKISAIKGVNNYQFVDKHDLKKGIYIVYLIYNGQKKTIKIIKS